MGMAKNIDPVVLRDLGRVCSVCGGRDFNVYPFRCEACGKDFCRPCAERHVSAEHPKLSRLMSEEAMVRRMKAIDTERRALALGRLMAAEGMLTAAAGLATQAGGLVVDETLHARSGAVVQQIWAFRQEVQERLDEMKRRFAKEETGDGEAEDS
jgi:hypothetical protein